MQYQQDQKTLWQLILSYRRRVFFIVNPLLLFGTEVTNG
jgi:hypothetical protein